MARPEVICLTNGQFQENCYIVADRSSGEAVLVDPGEESALFLRRLEHEGLDLTAVWLTHAHLDHVLGVRDVTEAVRVPIYLSSRDRFLYEDLPGQATWLGMSADPAPAFDVDLDGLTAVNVGGLEFEIRPVPGHSPGSVAFIGHGIAFVGDALFSGSIGRFDLPGGDGPELIESIRAQLLVLPDETVVYPGHGPSTLIGRERTTNPFLTGETPVG